MDATPQSLPATEYRLEDYTVAESRGSALSIALLSGPADGPLRKKIHDFALQHPSVFVGFVKPGGVHHTTIFTRDLLSARAAETMESEEKEEALKSAQTEFMTKDFPKLRAQLAGLGKQLAAAREPKLRQTETQDRIEDGNKAVNSFG